MNRTPIRREILLGVFLTMAWSSHPALAQHGKTGIDMPFQLTNGHIRTPAFSIKKRPYLIDVIVRTDLPHFEWCCLIKADGDNGSSYPACTSNPSHRIQASWTLWDGAQVVAQGPNEKSYREQSACRRWDGTQMDFFLGGFQAKKGEAYVLDLEFTNVDENLPLADAHLKVLPAPDVVP